MNYMNQQPPPATPLETASATPGGAQAVNTQVAQAPTISTELPPNAVQPVSLEGAAAPVAPARELTDAEVSKMIAADQQPS